MLKYFWPGKSILFYTGLIVLISLFTVFAKYTFTSPSSCQIDFLINTSAPVDFSIYYDIGKGLREEDQQSKYIEETGETMVSFCIPTYSEMRGIRFDPATRPVQMEIYELTLSYSDGTVFNVPFDALKPGNQIKRHEITEASFFFETEEDADDPTFSLTRIEERQDMNEKRSKIAHYALWICSAVILMVVGRFVYCFFFLGL
ncbi:hypothetical protein [Desulfopila inferna]|uniref:hypothetical protein n=1 Tax=Desulfopila inferna TaxID=468528 RepID=UPI00196512BD|nr:hypothetical protein [Desulfopila inferna]MBM9602724.1 hypothetical protein [Desulfopila inferna]